MLSIKSNSFSLKVVNQVPNDIPEGVEYKEVEIGFVDNLLKTLTSLTDKFPAATTLSGVISALCKNQFLDIAYDLEVTSPFGVNQIIGHSYLYVK